MTPAQKLKITTKGKLRVELAELHQWGTYVGLLDGAPTHEMNERLLEDVTRGPHDIPVHLVRPEERPTELPGQVPDANLLESPFGPHLFLPRYQCRGLFERGMFRVWIVWFQDTWAPPIDPVVRRELREFDFHSVAEEWNP